MGDLEPQDAPPKYRDKRTERFAAGDWVREFQAFKDQAERRLDILEAAVSKMDLMRLPSNRFEALGGDRIGQFSIRINQQWRVCFEWPDDHPRPFNIEIADYHRDRRLPLKERTIMPRDPIHPGQFLADELAELGMAPAELARELHVPANRIYQILSGRRAMTANTALRLGQWLGTSAELWMNLQKLYELRLAERQGGEEIRRTIAHRRPSAPEPVHASPH